MGNILRATIASSKADIKRGKHDDVIETSILWSTKPKRHFYDYTLLKQIRDANADNMDGTAISFFNTKMSYRQLIDETEHLAIAFRNAGIKAGDVVPICTITTPAIAPILLALCEIGAVSMWLYADSTKEEISKYINRVNAKIFVTGIGTEIVDRSAVTTVVKLPTMYLESGQHKESNVVDYFDFIEVGKGTDLFESISFDSNRPCVIVQSSGTTGAPKLIVHTLGNVRNFLEKYNHTDWDLSKGKVALNSMPPWIAYGLLNALFSCLCFGMEVRLALEAPGKGFSSVYDNIKDIDVAFTTPWHLKYVLEHLKPSERSIIKLSTVVTGGDKISAEELAQMEEAFGVMPVNGCGNTENLAGVVANPQFHNKPGSVGIPLWGNAVCIIDTESGEKLNLGANSDSTYNIGEICYHTNTLFSSYFGNPIATQAAKFVDEDGIEWMHTNDLGYIDDDGYVYICGRISEMITRGPDKISPDAIDEPMYNYGGDFIKICKTVGIPDAVKGNIPVTFVVLRDHYASVGKKAKEKIEAIKTKYIKQTYWPEHIIILSEKDMPFTKSGKPHTAGLKELARKYHEKSAIFN